MQGKEALKEALNRTEFLRTEREKLLKVRQLQGQGSFSAVSKTLQVVVFKGGFKGSRCSVSVKERFQEVPNQES